MDDRDVSLVGNLTEPGSKAGQTTVVYLNSFIENHKEKVKCKSSHKISVLLYIESSKVVEFKLFLVVESIILHEMLNKIMVWE